MGEMSANYNFPNFIRKFGRARVLTIRGNVNVLLCLFCRERLN